MSEPATAFNLARYAGLAEIAECRLQGMITLRGDLASRVFRAGAATAAGVKMPAQGMANIVGDSGLCWMSPDEILVLCPYDAVAARLDALNARLNGSFALAVNVSDARAIFCVSGPAAREVLAKLCPVDLAPDAFGPGMFRRTRMAQAAVAIWAEDDQTFRIFCFRSLAPYVFEVLKASAQPGAGVGYFSP